MGKLNIDINELVEESNKYKAQGPRCIIERLLRQVTSHHGDSEAQKLNQIIDNPDISTDALRKLLVKNGYDISVWQIRYHRKRVRGTGCRCPYVVQ